MPEEKATTAKSTKAETKDTGEGSITYEDHGDYIIEVDNRGADEVRTRRAKSQNAVPVDKTTHDSVEARVEAEKAAAENEGRDPESVTYQVPPLKEDKGKDAEPETVTVTAEGSK